VKSVLDPEPRPTGRRSPGRPPDGGGPLSLISRAGRRIMTTIRTIARFAYHLLDDLF
jgi:hypothetical protein